MRTRKPRSFQPYLLGFEQAGAKEFGGGLLKGNPRDARPISIKRPIHLVMRSSLATGEQSFLRRARARRIHALVHRLARLKGIRLYRFANAGNHLHLVLMPRSRRAYVDYVKAVTGLIARITLGTERGKSLGRKFWDARPYSRIVEWGREFRSVAVYVQRNFLEALGFIAYKDRRQMAHGRGPPLA